MPKFWCAVVSFSFVSKSVFSVPLAGCLYKKVLFHSHFPSVLTYIYAAREDTLVLSVFTNVLRLVCGLTWAVLEKVFVGLLSRLCISRSGVLKAPANFQLVLPVLPILLHIFGGSVCCVYMQLSQLFHPFILNLFVVLDLVSLFR
jgi:hypothetical protein